MKILEKFMLLGRKWHLSAAALVVLSGALPLSAQPLAPVCGKGLASFLIEHPVDVTAIQSTLTPHLDPAVAGLIFSGAREVRSRISYNAGTQVLRNELFLVTPGSLNPTPANFDVFGNRFGYLVVNVDRVQLSCTPAPAIALTGKIADGAPIFVDPTGAPYGFSFAYNMPPPSQNPFALRVTTVRDVASVSAGLGLLYHAGVPATIVFTDQPVGTSGPIILTSLPPEFGKVIPVHDNPYQIDASQSFDPNDLTLGFQWSSDKSVTFFPSATSPTAILTFGAGNGNYNITLTVTNTKSQSTKTTFTLAYSK